MDKTTGLFLLTVDWYNQVEDKEERHTAFCIAESYADAVRKAEMDLPDIIDIHIEAIIPDDYTSVNLIYMPEDEAIIEAIKRENDY